MSDLDWLNSIGDVKESSYAPMEDGTYDARLFDVENKRNKADTRNYFNLKWQVTEEPYDGRFQWTILSIPVQPSSADWEKTLREEFNGDAEKLKEKQEKVIEIFFNTLTTITGENWLDAETRPALNPREWIGAPVRLVIVKQWNDYRKVEDNNVKRILPPEDDSNVAVARTAKPSESKPERML